MAVRFPLGLALLVSLSLAAPAQKAGTAQDSSPGPNQPLPRSEGSAPDHPSTESSSRDTIIDLSPPPNDAKDHPDSGDALENSAADDVKEMHPFDPHRAMKDVEVGDFYFKRSNYGAAIDRYREALLYKPNDAIATIGLAASLEKVGELEEARKNYEAYLKVLPEGPKAADAHKGLQRLNKKTAKK